MQVYNNWSHFSVKVSFLGKGSKKNNCHIQLERKKIDLFSSFWIALDIYTNDFTVEG